MELRQFLCVAFSVLVKLSVSFGDFASSEAQLLQTLRSNYSTDTRPANATTVTLRLMLFALNDLDIGLETMSLSGVLIAHWRDTRLTWNPETNGIYKMVVKTQYVWLPSLVIENEINKVGVLGKDGTPLRLFPSGHIKWTPPISSFTTCSADITYYPYDKQTCTLTLISWTYSMEEVDIIVDSDQPIDQKYFESNGEWDLMDTSYGFVNITDQSLRYRKIQFNLTFRRKWSYYGQIVMLPIILNSVLITLVFRLPIESGEKMGYCLTVLLSYTVILTAVGDDLPPISTQKSIVQIYISIVMAVGTMGTLCTIGILRLYHRDEGKPVPQWLQKVTMTFLAPLTCSSRREKRVVSPVSREALDKSEDGKHVYTSKEIAEMMDVLLFPVFTILMTLMTITVVSLLMSRYDN